MKALTKKEKSLVSIGAAIAANCVPCITYHLASAKCQGFSKELLQEAIAVAEAVKKVPAELVAKAAAANILSDQATPPDEQDQCSPKCGC